MQKSKYHLVQPIIPYDFNSVFNDMKHGNIIFRITVLFLFVGSSLLILPDIKIDNSIERWLPVNSDETETYQNFLEEFNSDALLILSFETTNSSNQQQIDQGINSIRQLDHVIDVSTWPARHIRHKKKAQSHIRTYIIRFEPFSPINPNRPELIRDIKRIFKGFEDQMHLAGTGVIYEAINNQTADEMRNFIVLGIIILCLALIVLIRSTVPVLQTLSVGLGGIASIIWAFKIFGISLNLIHTIIPIIILFYSTSISLHILFHSGDFRKVLKPTLLVILTTSVGFFVFFINETPLLQDFAIIGLSGLTGSFFWSLILFYPIRYRYSAPVIFTRYFQQFPILPKKITIPGLIILLFICIPGILQIRAEIHSLSILNEGDKAYRDHSFTESKIGNYFPLEYFIDEKKIDRKQVSKWVNEVYQTEKIDAAIIYYHIPNTLNWRNAGYQSRKNPDCYRVTFMVPLMSTTDGQILVDSISKITGKYFKDHRPELTGFITLYGKVVDGLYKSFRQSLLFAFLIVFLVITAYLRNFSLIFYTLTVNIFPVILLLGLMGWLGIHLDMVTIPVGCLLISIVVDDTIHFMFWYKKRLNVEEALIKGGPGIFFTSMLLCSGFSILLFAQAPPVIYFAVLSLFALFTALLGDLILLPSFLKK
jgi:uncharacterized protein